MIQATSLESCFRKCQLSISSIYILDFTSTLYYRLLYQYIVPILLGGRLYQQYNLNSGKVTDLTPADLSDGLVRSFGTGCGASFWPELTDAGHPKRITPKRSVSLRSCRGAEPSGRPEFGRSSAFRRDGSSERMCWGQGILWGRWWKMVEG